MAAMSSIGHPDMDRPICHSHRVPNRSGPLVRVGGRSSFGTSVSARSTPPQKHIGETSTKASNGRRPAFRILFVNTHQRHLTTP